MAIHNYIGSWGEMMAQRYLLLRDYHIRDVDWHCGHCDLDIVAEKLGFIIFVEVKTIVTRYATCLPPEMHIWECISLICHVNLMLLP